MKKILRVFLWAVAVPIVLLAQTTDIFQRPEHFERSRDFDALHYRLTLAIDDAHKTVRGENAVTLSSLKDDLKTIALDALDFKVTAVAGPDGAPLEFEQTAAQVLVRLRQPLAYGEKMTLAVSYTLTDPKRGLKFMAETADAPAQVDTYNWPEDGRRWFPCFDDPHDKATSEILATVRADWSVLSNGRLVDMSEDRAAGTKTFHWLQDKPHPTCNVMLAAGPYEVVRDKCGDLPVDYWVYKKDVADAPRSFQKTPRMIEFYGRVFDYAYPWAKYAQVCVSGSGGGMEATTATILGHGTIHDARADQDFSSDGLVAHELAHQWWGDCITERDWADVWLSESFATYAEYLWTRYDRGEDEGALNLEEKKNSYLAEAKSRYMRPVVFNRYNSPWDIMDSHSYPKGATILHMLRFVLGDKPFFRALSRFLHDYEFRSVDTHDFMAAVKEATGENMDWFFEQWIYKAGHPVFDVSYAWDAEAKKVRLRVAQTQDELKIPTIYRTPVVVGLVFPDKAASEKVWLSHQEDVFEFDAPQKPLLVRFDEGNYLLKQLVFAKEADELVYQLRNDDAVGRQGAAQELVRFRSSPAVITALKTAAQGDTFWAVRRRALQTLAGVQAPDLVPVLQARAADKHSRVREAALRALAEYKDKTLVKFFQERFAKDDSYVAQAAALAAIGQCGDSSAVGFLKKAATLTSPRLMLKNAAEAAVKSIESRAASKKH
jgi:aminopeptidase N